MKRDMDLARDILLALEEHRDPMEWADLLFEGRSALEVSYHIMLLSQAGLIVARDASDSDGLDWKAFSLTWAGHEFLDAARSNPLWKKALTRVSTTVGTVSFSVMTELLKQMALEALGMKP